VGVSALGSGLAGLVATTAHRADVLLAAKMEAVEVKADEAARRAAELIERAERVIELPDDAHGWHVTVFTRQPPAAGERELLSWFESDMQLARLKQQTHFHH